MAVPEVSRRERKKEETKDRIFQAAFALFKQHGVEQTTVEEICDKADVAKGTFFNYFPYKEAVLRYVAETWFVQAQDESTAIFARPGRLAPQLIRMFSELAAFYEQERTLAPHVLREWMQNQYSGEDEMCERWDELAVTLIKKLQESGEIRDDEDAERIARVLQSVHQVTILEYVASPTAPFPLRNELRRRLTLALEGLASSKGK
ncbi:MAG TPA: TetR/AcrR family transcriptional regulator [Gemmatimonadales bacterium]|nr:TetR/AcrR family transcriptional regulator [Gemmatimonadales bacterium]